MIRVIDQLSFFVGLLDTEGTLVWANNTAIHVGGLELSDVVGLPFWECYWWTDKPSTQARLKRHVEHVIKTGEAIEPWDVHVLIAGGARLLIEFHLTPHVVGGEVIGAIPHAAPVRGATPQGLHDIAQRLLASTERDDRERVLLARSIEVVPVPMVIVDADGREVVTNDAARRTTRADTTLPNVVDDWRGEYFDANMQPISNHQTPLARSLAHGEEVEGEVMYARFVERSSELLKIQVWSRPVDINGHRYGATCYWQVIL